MKSALYASAAFACLAFAVPANAQQPTREPSARSAQSETKSPDAMKPETAPGRHTTGAAAKPANPEEGKGPAMRSDRPGGGERGAEATKPQQRPARADEQEDRAPKTAETKPDGREQKANRPDNNDRATQGGSGRSKDAATRDKAGTGAPATGENRENARTERGDARTGERPRLDDTQRSRMSAYLNNHRGPRVDRPNFGVEVGVRVPTRIRIAPLPREIIEIVPEYRGYDYVIVENDIVIIQPRTREIVTVIPAGVSSSARTTKLDPCGNRS